MQNKSQKDKARLAKQQQLLQGYLSPAVESVAPGNTPPTASKAVVPTKQSEVDEFVDNVFFITDHDYSYDEETPTSSSSLNTDYYYDR